jgi:nickel/cobalt exporter
VKSKLYRYKICIISFFIALLTSISLTTASLAHWADLAVAEITLGETQTSITLTLPIGLVAKADDDNNGQISKNEVAAHKNELERFLGERIVLSDNKGQKGTLSINASDTSYLAPTLRVNTNTHTVLELTYSWLQPVEGIKIHYDLFLPEAPAAHCLATIFYQGKVENFIFNRQNRDFSITSDAKWLFGSSSLVAIAAAFVWGAMHAMSPGHGKTIVAAYLIGEQATAQQALFLGLTTTLTHTIGVFAI